MNRKEREVTQSLDKSSHEIIGAAMAVHSELGAGYRIDLMVEETIIIELKTVERFLPIHTAQLLSYLKMAEKKLGLLINFNVTSLKHGIKRVVNDL